MKFHLTLLAATLMAQAANAADDVSKRLPDIPTSASPYSDYAPGSFQQSSALKLPEKGDSFFLLVTP